MAAKHTAKGYHTVTPALVVRGGAEAIEFYKRAFGAEERGRFPGPDGKLMHAEIQIGDSIVMLADENPEYHLVSPFSTNGVPVSLYLYVDDADAAFDRAVKAGAKVRMPLEDQFWGDRYGQVADPFGHEWGIATRVKEMSPEEMRKAGEAFFAQAAQR